MSYMLNIALVVQWTASNSGRPKGKTTTDSFRQRQQASARRHHDLLGKREWAQRKWKCGEKRGKVLWIMRVITIYRTDKKIEDNNSEVIEGFIYTPRNSVYRHYWSFYGSLMKSRELYAMLCIPYVRMTMCANRMNEKLNDSGPSKLRIVKFQLNYLVVLFFRIFVEVIKILKQFFFYLRWKRSISLV